MPDTPPQVIPLYRRSPSELLEEWERDERDHSQTLQELRRRLHRADPDRGERFRFAIQVEAEHLAALRHRIARAKGFPPGDRSAPVSDEEPERVLRWQSR